MTEAAPETKPEPSYPDSFADHPESVTEIVSQRAGTAATRKPRDVLIHVLKLIDRGDVDPDHLIVVYRSPLTKYEDGRVGTETFWAAAGPDPHVIDGIMLRVITKG